MPNTTPITEMKNELHQALMSLNGEKGTQAIQERISRVWLYLDKNEKQLNAAPALLGELEAVLEFGIDCEQGDIIITRKHVEAIRAALKQAKGE